METIGKAKDKKKMYILVTAVIVIVLGLFLAMNMQGERMEGRMMKTCNPALPNCD